MHQNKSQTTLSLKDKDSNFLSQDFPSRWVSTEVDYTVMINDKPTKIRYKMVKAQIRRYQENRGDFLNKNRNESIKFKNCNKQIVEYNKT